MNDFIEELVEQVQKAEEIALEKHITTNAIFINKDFDLSREFLGKIGNRNFYISPMICGKHIFVGKLPKQYSFVLTKVDEKAYRTELDYYKNRCEELEAKFEAIKEQLT